MSVLVTADLHFSDNPRDNYRHVFVDTLIATIQEYDVKTLLVLGDLTEKKDKHSAWLVNQVAEHFNVLSSWVKIIILQGNHDALDVECPFFRFLHLIRSPRRIRWISDPTETDIEGLGRCLFLPHTHDYRKRWENLFRSNTFDFIFAHNTFDGTISESGMTLDGVPTSVFPKGVPVIAGDIHKPQQVGPVTYVGSPYLIDFGDDFEPRMLLIKPSGKIESIACPGPQKRIVHASDVLSDDMTIVGTLNPDDVIKVKVEVTREEYSRWNEIQRKIREWSEDNGANVHTIQPIVEAAGSQREQRKGTNSKERESDEKLIKRYAAGMRLGSKIVRVGLSISEK